MSEKPRRPWIAAVLSLSPPGLGQLYGGELKRALAVSLAHIGLIIGLLAVRLPGTFSGLIIFILVALSFLLWVIWDAVRIARRKKDYVLKPYNRWYLYLAIVLVTGFLWPRLLAFSPIRAFRIPSGSMEPALRIGDHIYADMTYYRSAKPARGDLVVFESPESPERILTGRVIGLGGERIEVRNKKVYIAGQPLDDPWGRSQSSPASGNPQFRMGDNLGVEIPPDAFFVMGDNRGNSHDSRFFGPVHRSLLRGRLLYVYWASDRSRIGISLK